MLTMKDIIRDGHPTRAKAEDVSLPLSDEDKNTLKEMRQFLINSQDDLYLFIYIKMSITEILV